MYLQVSLLDGLSKTDETRTGSAFFIASDQRGGSAMSYAIPPSAIMSSFQAMG